MATAWSVNKYVRKNLFGSPSSHNITRPYDNHGTCRILLMRSAYSVASCIILATIFQHKILVSHNTCLLGIVGVKCGNMGERNSIHPENGILITRSNHDCSATRVGQRPVGAIIVQCNPTTEFS
jgi:hypothetical protein